VQQLGSVGDNIGLKLGSEHVRDSIRSDSSQNKCCIMTPRCSEKGSSCTSAVLRPPMLFLALGDDKTLFTASWTGVNPFPFANPAADPEAAP
jgi:hypothetical protein